MKKSYILLLIVVLLIVIFAIQNANSVLVQIFSLNFSAPLALIIIGSIILGTLFALIISIPGIRKGKQEIKEKNKIIKEKENRISALEKSINETAPLLRDSEDNFEANPD